MSRADHGAARRRQQHRGGHPHGPAALRRPSAWPRCSCSRWVPWSSASGSPRSGRSTTPGCAGPPWPRPSPARSSTSKVRAGDARRRSRRLDARPAQRDGRRGHRAREAVDRRGGGPLVGRGRRHRTALPARPRRPAALRHRGRHGGAVDPGQGGEHPRARRGRAARGVRRHRRRRSGRRSSSRPTSPPRSCAPSSARSWWPCSRWPWACSSPTCWRSCPLAVSLARRVERGQEHHAQVLRRSLLATHRERLRIAHDLHDGVVQDLAGLRYAMPLVANQLPPTPDASLARQTVADAYAMLGTRHRGAALADHRHPPARPRGARSGRGGPGPHHPGGGRRAPPSTSTCPTDPDWSLGTSRLVYRVLQEGLRNVVAHSGATRAAVTVRRRGRRGARRGERRRPWPGRQRRAASPGTSGCSCCARTSRTSAAR